MGSGTSVVSSDDRDFVLLTRNVWIPERARCCTDHLTVGRFKQEALSSIKPFSIRHQEWNSSDVGVGVRVVSLSTPKPTHDTLSVRLQYQS